MSMSYRSVPLSLIFKLVIWPLECVLLFVLLGILRLLPIPVASGMMAGLFRLIGPYTAWHRRTLLHLCIAFPDKDKSEAEAIATNMWDNLGRNVGEYMHLDRMLASSRISFEGIEHLDRTQGGIIIGAHLANWEALSMLGAEADVPVGLIYRPLNNPYANLAFRRRAAVTGADIYQKGREASLGMLRTLRKNGFMLMLVDQQLREGISIPFFGHPAQTAISHIRVALKQDKPIYLARVTRHNSAHIKVGISPALAVKRKADIDKETIRLATYINKEIEGWITDMPALWLWPHRRWGKDMPASINSE